LHNRLRAVKADDQMEAGGRRRQPPQDRGHRSTVPFSAKNVNI